MVLASPTLVSIDDVTLADGAPLWIPLDGYDSDGDALTYEVTIANSTLSGLEYSVPEGNRSLRLTVEGYGEMVFELFEDLAPTTTEAIIDLVEAGFYDGVSFHRVVADFVIQAGDRDDADDYDVYTFDDEFSDYLMHTSEGILSMAKAFDDTNSSQFFITDSAQRYLDFSHSVFGRLIEGDNVREAIQNVDVDDDDAPLTDVVISSAEIFTDDENGALMLYLPSGATSGECDVTVTVTDTDGNTSEQTFHVTAEADDQNSMPYLEEIATIVTQPDTPVSFQIPARDVEGDAIYYSVLNADSELSVTCDEETGAVTVTPLSGATGVYTIEVRCSSSATGVSEDYSDYSYYFDYQEVVVKVTETPTGAIVLATSADTAPGDATNNDSLTKRNNSDGNELTFRVNGWEPGAEVRVYANGELIATKTTDADSTLSSLIVRTDGETTLADGTYTITATQVLNGSETAILDTNGNAAQTTVVIDATAPTFTSSAVAVAKQGVAYAYNAETDEEDESGSQYQLVSAPQGMTIDTSTGVVQWDEPLADGPYTVTIRAWDAAGNSTDQTFELTVNLAPVISAIDAQRVTEENQLVLQIVAEDPEGDDSLTFTLGSDAPTGAKITASTGVFRWTPTEMQGPGEYAITVWVTDSSGARASMTFEVQVDEKNEPPAIGAVADQQAAEHTELRFVVSATDGDLPDDELRFSLAGNAPAGASIDGETGRFTWTPTERQGGRSYAITVRVTDKTGDISETTFHVAVAEDDQVPVFDAVESPTLAPGEVLELQVQARDPDVPANTIVYQLEEGSPAGATIDPSTGQVRWVVTDTQTFSTVTFRVRAVEIDANGQAGLSSVLAFEVRVTGLIDAAFLLRAAEGDGTLPLGLDDEGLALAELLAEGRGLSQRGLRLDPVAVRVPVADSLFDSATLNAGIGVDGVGGGVEDNSPGRSSHPAFDDGSMGTGTIPSGGATTGQDVSRTSSDTAPARAQRAAATDEALAELAAARAAAEASSREESAEVPPEAS